MLVQLKPHHEAFYRFVFDKLMRLNALILCEGKTEVEVVKKIAEKLGISLQDFSVGVTDCEEIEVVSRMTSAVLALARLSRRLKVMVVIIDAEDMNVKDRIRSFVDGLRARGTQIGVQVFNPSPINDQVYSVKVIVENRTLAMIIAINGVFTLSFQRHKLEDHAVKLLLLSGKMSDEDLERYKDSKEVIGRNRIVELIEDSNEEHVKCAFNHIHLALLKLFSMLRSE